MGTKLDLRDDKEWVERMGSSSAVSSEEGVRLQTVNSDVVQYIECSSLTRYGVDKVFEEAARATTDKRISHQRNSKCYIM